MCCLYRIAQSMQAVLVGVSYLVQPEQKERSSRDDTDGEVRPRHSVCIYCRGLALAYRWCRSVILIICSHLTLLRGEGSRQQKGWEMMRVMRSNVSTHWCWLMAILVLSSHLACVRSVPILCCMRWRFKDCNGAQWFVTSGLGKLFAWKITLILLVKWSDYWLRHGSCDSTIVTAKIIAFPPWNRWKGNKIMEGIVFKDGGHKSARWQFCTTKGADRDGDRKARRGWRYRVRSNECIMYGAKVFEQQEIGRTHRNFNGAVYADVFRGSHGFIEVSTT